MRRRFCITLLCALLATAVAGSSSAASTGGVQEQAVQAGVGTKHELKSRNLLQSTVEIWASTPQPAEDGLTYTWVEDLASALLAAPGMFWGTVPADDINAACTSIVNTGSYSFSATVYAYDRATATTLTVQATGGCLAGDTAPVGTQMVVSDTAGRSFAIICTDYSWDIGCSVYLTGDDITAIASQLRDSSTSGKRRALLSRRLMQGGNPCGPSAGGATCGDQCCSQWGYCGVEDGHCADGCQSGYGRCGSSTGGGVVLHPIPSGDAPVTDVDNTNDIACGAGTAAAAGAGVGAAIGCAATLIFAPLCWAAAGTTVVASSVGACAGKIEEADSDCFPAHAAALLCDGTTARMDSLRLGDMLAVRRPNGSLGCEPIYVWGHQQAGTTSEFVRLELAFQQPAANATAAAAALELTAGHFVPVMQANGRTLHKRAADVAAGDVMWALQPADGGSQLALARVIAVSRVLSTGLYNPYTLGGTLIVDGVLASAHSEWFADQWFDAVGVTAHLPAFYQAVLALPRLLWHLLGRDAYLQLYARLDSEIGLASLCGAKGCGVAGPAYAMARALGGAAAMLGARYAGAAATWAASAAVMCLMVLRRESGGAPAAHGRSKRSAA